MLAPTQHLFRVKYYRAELNMSLMTDALQALLRVQAETARIRTALAGAIGTPLGVSDELMSLTRELTQLEARFAQEIARALGAVPMATGGLVTSPTFALLGEAGPELVIPVKKQKRKLSKYGKTLKKELAIVSNRARKKDGSFKAGYDQARVMREAHRLTRKVMKRK